MEYPECVFFSFFWSWRGIREKKKVMNQDHKPYEEPCILTDSSNSSWTFLCTSEISINTTPEKKNETLLLHYWVLFPFQLDKQFKVAFREVSSCILDLNFSLHVYSFMTTPLACVSPTLYDQYHFILLGLH